MPLTYENNFAPFGIKALSFQFPGAKEPSVYETKCAGTLDQEDEIAEGTKPCGRTVIDRVTWLTGNGTVDISAHFPENLNHAIYNMAREDLIEGVFASGNSVVLPQFTLIARIYDLRKNEKIRIWPCITVAGGGKLSVDNSSTEAGYQDLSLYYVPDEHGEGWYDVLVDKLGENAEALIKSWMEGFNLDTLYKAVEA